MSVFFFLSPRLNLIRSKSHTYEWFIRLSQSHSSWLSTTDAPPPRRMTLPQKMSLSQCQDKCHGKPAGAFPKPEQPGAQQGSIHCYPYDGHSLMTDDFGVTKMGQVEVRPWNRASNAQIWPRYPPRFVPVGLPSLLLRWWRWEQVRRLSH